MANPEPEPRFLADAMLGGLARWMRVLDLDVSHDPELDDPELVERAVAEDRVILTRDRKLVERRRARNHHLVEAHRIDGQVREVLAVFELSPDSERWFTRCLACNVSLVSMPAEVARRRVPPWVARTQERYHHCPACDRVFWRASHVRRMRARLERLLPGREGGPAGRGGSVAEVGGDAEPERREGEPPSGPGAP